MTLFYMLECMEKLKAMPNTTLNWSSAIEEFVNVIGVRMYIFP